MDLIGTLTSQLGIGKEQAEGAAGAIFGAIKAEAPAGDFQALADKIPEAAGWMNAAAALTGGGGGGAPDLGGLLGGALSGMLGGGGGAAAAPSAGGLLGSAMQSLGGAGGNLGALASLLPLLQNLKLDQNILSQLAPIVLNFIQQRMGAEAIGKLTQGSPLLGQLASMAGGSGGAGGLAGMVGKLF